MTEVFTPSLRQVYVIHYFHQYLKVPLQMAEIDFDFYVIARPNHFDCQRCLDFFCAERRVAAHSLRKNFALMAELKSVAVELLVRNLIL